MHDVLRLALDRDARHNPRDRRRIGGGAVALLVAAAILTSGLIAAPAAQAGRSGHVWSRVAACESSGRWHVNTGNHFYGGLQFWAATWRAYGGQKFAPRADLATRRQQIAVARRVLAAQGPGAWPVCSKRAGLTRRTGGATSSALPNIGPYRRWHHRHVTRHRHRWHPRHVTHRHHRSHHRVHFVRYVVRSGDSLSSIAQRHHVRGGWAALWRLNRGRVANPNAIVVGQVLRIR